MPEYALEIKELTKSYESGVQALRGVSLKVQSGDFFALLGANGAGKSTTIGIVTSLVNKTSGDVHVFGENLEQNPEAVKRYIGLVPQEVNFNQFEKVFNIVMAQAGYYGLTRDKARERTEICLKQLDLWEKRDQTSRSLSGGMKRRLMIARALVHEPKLLILDEPTAGVDIEIRHSMWAFLRKINQEGTTIILTTHYLEEAESLCRHIAIIKDGEVIENTDMKTLLGSVKEECFLLTLKTMPEVVPDIDGFSILKVDDHSWEVRKQEGISLNVLFTALSQLEIEVLGVRNQVNRLEQMFLKLIEKGGQA